MRGFTPFCLQKMEQTNEISLRLLEEKMQTTMYTTMNDLITRDKSLKFTPITDALGRVPHSDSEHIRPVTGALHAHITANNGPGRPSHHHDEGPSQWQATQHWTIPERLVCAYPLDGI